ncbi:MAG: MSMEG_1061 family FMN-dependent PPOX-type flavoprotein [Pseudomonadota bacterium]
MADVFGLTVELTVEDAAALRGTLGEPSERAANKVTDRIDAPTARWIAASPFAVMATRRADGGVDLTPRGDPPGFAKVLSPEVLALPERPGNRRGDALENLLADPRLGLIFLIPGEGATLRISGEAKIVRDAGLAERMEVRGHRPDLILLLRVERVLSHCPKALIRSSLWRPEAWPDRNDVPSMAELMVAHGAPVDREEMEAVIERDSRERLY